MSKKDFVILCLRLLAIYITITGIASLPNILAMVLDSTFFQGLMIVSPLLYIAIGVSLYFSAPKLRSYIVEFSETDDHAIEISPNEKTARIALMVLGVYIFAHALPRFIHLSIDAGIFYKQMDGVNQSVQGLEHRWFFIIPSMVEMIIAAILIVGSDKVIAWVSKFDDTFKQMNVGNKADSEDK